MAKEFRQNRRAAGGKELERKVTAGSKGRGRGWPLCSDISNTPSRKVDCAAIRVTLRTLYILPLSASPPLSLSVPHPTLSPFGQNGENVTRRGERRNARRNDKEGASEILAEAVILMRVVLKFYVTPCPRRVHQHHHRFILNAGLNCSKVNLYREHFPTLIRLCGLAIRDPFHGVKLKIKF